MGILEMKEQARLQETQGLFVGAYLEEKQTARLFMTRGNGGSYSKLPRAWQGEQEVFSWISAFQREPLQKAGLGGGRSTS